MYVELKDINKTFGDYKASDHVSFGIEKGKLIGLLGPSGSGKTTILRMIAGLEQPDSGEIIIDGKVVNDIPASERGIGFVFQSYPLYDRIRQRCFWPENPESRQKIHQKQSYGTDRAGRP